MQGLPDNLCNTKTRIFLVKLPKKLDVGCSMPSKEKESKNNVKRLNALTG